MDIDDIFKAPKLPSGGNKRKLPDNPTPDMLKKMKMDMSAPSVPQDTIEKAVTNGNSRSHAVSIEEVHDEDGSDFAPGGDADYFMEEDEEGRFYGGGLTGEQKDILNIFDNAGGEGVLGNEDGLNITAIRRSLLRFERAANKNQDQRSKYPDDPTRFIDSEADLDSAIKSLIPLAQEPALAYPEVVRSGTLSLLIGLLSHENADIVIDVVEVIHEFTDDDEDAEEEEERAEGLKILVDDLLGNSILELLVDNLTRLKETEESDRQGVFHILGIFENLVAFDPKLSEELVSKTKILSWLLSRIQIKTHDDNRGYAAELLSILLQNDSANRVALGKQDGMEILLTVVSQYRKHNPPDQEEVEFMENTFDALCSCLSEPPNKKLFLASEGTDLMLIMAKSKLECRSRAIKALDYSMSGSSGDATSEAFIKNLGLKTLFSVFMAASKKNKGAGTPPSEDTAHLLSIMASLFSNIASDTPERIRLLTKFVENEFEKVDKLLEIRDNAKLRLAATDIGDEEGVLDDVVEKGDLEEILYLRRLENGLFTLQTVDYILAWIAMEDDGIRAHILQMLGRRSQDLQDIVGTLKVYYENVDDPPNLADDSPSLKDILAGLIGALDPAS